MQQKPLAERLRPKNLDEFQGQPHLVGLDGVLRKILEKQVLPSLIFWGPPGTGKTTLAHILADQLGLPFYALSAIQTGVKDIRKVIDTAEKQGKALLFIDEIHRFHKGQQDALLSAVEKGTLTLIGATTENPSFEVNSALLSRCQVFELYALAEEDLKALVWTALNNDPVLKAKQVTIEAWEALLTLGGGDARRVLNLLELVIEQAKSQPVTITNETVKAAAQEKPALYDKDGEQHYDIISAFIKSIRGSDPNAAVYWLARMIEGGEDPKFIARRLLILASEDIGNANPNAMVLANDCFQGVDAIGFPEGRILLSQTAIYLANSPKSNAAYEAINQAQQLVKATGDLPVPLHLRNAPTNLMKSRGYGKGYQYAHHYAGNFVQQAFMPEQIDGTKLYEPGNNPKENEARKRLKGLWQGKYGY